MKIIVAIVSKMESSATKATWRVSKKLSIKGCVVSASIQSKQHFSHGLSDLRHDGAINSKKIPCGIFFFGRSKKTISRNSSL